MVVQALSQNAPPKGSKYYGMHTISRGQHKGVGVHLYKNTNGSGYKFYIIPGTKRRSYVKGHKALHCAKYPGDQGCPHATKIIADPSVSPGDPLFFSKTGMYKRPPTRNTARKIARRRDKRWRGAPGKQIERHATLARVRSKRT